MQFNDDLTTKQQFKIPTLNVWSELYKTKLIKGNNIKFLDGTCMCEDQAFNMICFPKAKVIKTIENKLYYYRINNLSSLCHTVNQNKHKYDHSKNIENVYNDWMKNDYFNFNEAKINFLNWRENNIYWPNSKEFNTNIVKKVITNGNDNILPNGTYQTVSAIGNNKVVDIGNATKKSCGNVQLWDKNGTNAQKFEIKYNPNGWYTIKAKCSGLMLDVQGANHQIGTNIQQYSNNSTDAQKWYIIPKENGYYNIISKCNRLYMDVYGGNCKNGTNIQCWQGNNTNAQSFKFIK